MRIPPIIITARVHPEDLAPFNRLRQENFPPEGNFLEAHVTIFHHLPGQHLVRVRELVAKLIEDRDAPAAVVSGVRHLGAGVAFAIDSPGLLDLRAEMVALFGSWPGPQDLRKWRPHITIQNKAPRAKADALFFQLREGFERRPIRITGIDLSSYLGGPWQHEATVPFKRDEEPK
ncbi:MULTISPECIES: 2'-5' RNA ligase family protein [unclassified Rhizobium]|uniref:2'-5' RNA ligase family protein n=1 Tax=unclassified Rhizobium TaxID=2613769 RepID=UPI001FE0F882|nr:MULTISPECIES: 2'-5' RNA ligase family protein [unclassified Rhizobium]